MPRGQLRKNDTCQSRTCQRYWSCQVFDLYVRKPASVTLILGNTLRTLLEKSGVRIYGVTSETSGAVGGVGVELARMCCQGVGLRHIARLPSHPEAQC